MKSARSTRKMCEDHAVCRRCPMVAMEGTSACGQSTLRKAVRQQGSGCCTGIYLPLDCLITMIKCTINAMTTTLVWSANGEFSSSYEYNNGVLFAHTTCMSQSQRVSVELHKMNKTSLYLTRLFCAKNEFHHLEAVSTRFLNIMAWRGERHGWIPDWSIQLSEHCQAAGIFGHFFGKHGLVVLAPGCYEDIHWSFYINIIPILVTCSATNS